VISINGCTGSVFLGEVPVVASLVVDTPQDSARARRFGAQGIGLCRTEHMFLDDRRIHVERLILAADDKERQDALAELLPLQRTDFRGDPDSVHFFHDVGLDYVSCSPFRVPVARLEAGRAAVRRYRGSAIRSTLPG
jgi:phosphoenolpyruvate synthase/pyruvate phosphate dikinase